MTRVGPEVPEAGETRALIPAAHASFTLNSTIRDLISCSPPWYFFWLNRRRWENGVRRDPVPLSQHKSNCGSKKALCLPHRLTPEHRDEGLSQTNALFISNCQRTAREQCWESLPWKCLRNTLKRKTMPLPLCFGFYHKCYYNQLSLKILHLHNKYCLEER